MKVICSGAGVASCRKVNKRDGSDEKVWLGCVNDY